MTYRIVLPVDGSLYARWAGEFTCRHLVGGDQPIRVSLVHVATPVSAVDARSADPAAVEQFYAAEAARMFKPFRSMLQQRSIGFDPNPRVGNPGVEIARHAEEMRATLIVMGARGVGALHEMAFGSTLHRVLAESTVPVIALRKPPARRKLRRAMVAIDGSAQGLRAVDAFLRLRPLLGGALSIDVVNVARRVSLRESIAFGLGPRDRYYERESAKAMQPALAALARAGVDADRVAGVGDPGETIAALAAERGADLVVVGSHGRGGARRLVMGSVSRSVLARTEVPVMIVR
jgi:nucleotide-binding universal stress UspA family protein